MEEDGLNKKKMVGSSCWMVGVGQTDLRNITVCNVRLLLLGIFFSNLEDKAKSKARQDLTIILTVVPTSKCAAQPAISGPIMQPKLIFSIIIIMLDLVFISSHRPGHGYGALSCDCSLQHSLNQCF